MGGAQADWFAEVGAGEGRCDHEKELGTRGTVDEITAQLDAMLVEGGDGVDRGNLLLEEGDSPLAGREGWHPE